MPGERVIHTAIFILWLIVLCSLAGWIRHTYLTELILQVTAIALSWGTILLVLYVALEHYTGTGELSIPERKRRKLVIKDLTRYELARPEILWTNLQF